MQFSKAIIPILAVILLVPSQAIPVPPEQAGPHSKERGAAIYTAYCAACHGESGDGKGPMAGQLPTDSSPPPADLTSWILQGSRSDKSLRKVIRGGGSAAHKSSYMPAWSQTLTDGQIDDVVAYIRDLKKGTPPDLINIEPLENELQIGKALYSIRCLPCHGATGRGGGFLLDSLVGSGGAPLEVAMPDFSRHSTFGRISDDDLESVISSGISHSKLALKTSNGWWNRPLELAEVRALILYLRTLPLAAETSKLTPR